MTRREQGRRATGVVERDARRLRAGRPRSGSRLRSGWRGRCCRHAASAVEQHRPDGDVGAWQRAGVWSFPFWSFCALWAAWAIFGRADGHD